LSRVKKGGGGIWLVPPRFFIELFPYAL